MTLLQTTTRAPLLNFGLAALPPLFFAGNFVLARAMRDEIPPLQFSFWRWLLAFVIFAPFAARYVGRDVPVIRREWPQLAALSLLGVTAFNSLVYVALHHTTAINAAVINTMLPIFIIGLSFLVLKQRLSPRQVLGLALSIGGALVTILGSGRNTLSFDPGDLLVLLAGLSWAIYTVITRWRPLPLHPMTFLFVTFGLGSLFHLPFIAWEFSAKGGFALTQNVALTLLYVAIFPSVLAYTIWNRSVAAIGPGRTSMFMYLMPIYGSALAVWLIGESFRWYHAAGIALIIGGLVLANRPPARPVTQATAKAS